MSDTIPKYERVPLRFDDADMARSIEPALKEVLAAARQRMLADSNWLQKQALYAFWPKVEGSVPDMADAAVAGVRSRWGQMTLNEIIDYATSHRATEV